MPTGLAALRLLVVDDNQQFRSILGAVLSGAGVGSIHYANDGRRGLEMLHGGGIDVILVDYEMPVMNGLDFLSAVRGSSDVLRFAPIIMLTGHSDLKRLAEARDRGVTEFLGKPVTAKTILSRLNTVLLHPRPFVKTLRFFGPDRRRRVDPNYRGPLRRASDSEDVLEL